MDPQLKLLAEVDHTLSEDEFYDAVSVSKSSDNLSDTSFNSLSNHFGNELNLNDDSSEISQEEIQIIQIKKAQFDKFERREEYLNLREAINQEDFLKPNEFGTQANDPRFIRSIFNKQCRDELLELRRLHNPDDADELNHSFEHSTIKKIQKNPIETDNNINTKLIDRKYKTFSPSSSQNSAQNIKKAPKDLKIIFKPNDLSDYSEKFKTWPSNSHNQTDMKTHFTNVECSLHDKSEFESTFQSDPIRFENLNKTNESINLSLNLDADKSDKLAANSVSTMDEFINPVDKQIAALFQLSSHSSSLINEHNTSDINNSNSPLSDNNHSDLHKNEINNSNSECDGLEGDEHSKNEPFNKNSHLRSSKKNFNFPNINKKLDSCNSISSKTSIKTKTKQSIRNVFNKFGRAVRNKAEEVLHHEKELSDTDSDDAVINEATKTIKYKAARCNKASHEFNKVQIVQILHSNQPAQSPTLLASNSASSQSPPSNCILWAMKFSHCGKLLASVGKDQLIRIWVLRAYYESFSENLKKHNPSSVDINLNNTNFADEQTPFCSKPLMIYSGHTSDILDVSWSRNLFLLSASSDKSCRLWHIYKTECLCTFYHSSIISAISFHPKDDRYFISACLDGKLRLWNIAEKKVVLWNELNGPNQSNQSNFITAVSFCQSGKTIAIGTFDGKCILYHTEHLKYYSLINVRSTKGRNSRGSKITGIEVLNNDENKILITSNDSRIRLYDLRDLSLVCKYKGFSNSTVHIKASLSPDDQYIISGSKDKCTYLWKTNYNFSMLNSGRRDRNMYWERIQAHNAIVTCALFSPKPQLILNNILNKTKTTPLHSADKSAKFNLTRRNSNSKESKLSNEFQVFVSAAGCDGDIKIFTNKSNF